MTTPEDSSKHEVMSRNATVKAMKRPDDFFQFLTGFFDGMTKHSRFLVGMIVVLLAVGAASAAFMTKKDERTQTARDALFRGRQELDKELKAIAVAKAPAVAPVKEIKDAKKDSKSEPKAPDADSVAFEKLDVDMQLSAATIQLKKVVGEFNGTRPAQDARFALGDLYFNHGQAEKAVSWYQGAVDGASGSAEKAFALYSLGYAQENAGKNAEAAQTFEKGMNLGEPSIKADMMLSMARVQEVLKKRTEALSTYNLVISQFPNSEFSKRAEVRKSHLSE